MITFTVKTGIFASFSAFTSAAAGPELLALSATAHTCCWMKAWTWESWLESLSSAIATLIANPSAVPLSWKLFCIAM